ncbi:phosphatase PAP2 family protein [Flavobacterium hibernum]|uniref:Phosphatase PAP2 family protein n=1 Tax=Flavobacterium hibernum TaxID=37752 RepID=A0A0D0ELL9_9FLAO|nr:phosphatase PAP2 family protein [Flavobacterium hibernum]KIO52960.1 phosphoesterase [Flavobacterium hibernum]OXA88603.1 phosphatase PAP2 family protein [Flavobacterium hibernum]STO15260.1 phosphatidylglycerophosphatase B [Flavobacterium hibernum]
MLERIKELDTELLIYLNGLGSETYDKLWLVITNQFYWTPFFLLLFYLIYKKLGGKQTLYLLLFIAVLITFTDQVTNLFKYTFQRPRPCNNPEINTIIRVVQTRTSYSFFSGHAANTMAVATFLFFVLRRYFKYLGFLFLWPLIFAYSRIYLGLHYPGDILTGYFFGALFGSLLYLVYKKLKPQYFPG